MADATLNPSSIQARGPATRPAARSAPAMTLAVVFVFVLLIPGQFSFDVGGFLITPVRLFMLGCAPLVLGRFFGARLYSFDYAYLAFVFWTVMCIGYNRGIGAVQPMGQFFLEFGLIYMLARVSLRSPEQVELLVKVLVFSVAVLMIFALFESLVIRRAYLNDFFNSLVGKPLRNWRDGPGRFGITRARTIFVHPILFGLYCASTLGFAFWIFRQQATRIVACAVIVIATFLSVSSGPFLSAMIQIAMIGTYFAMQQTGVSLKQVLLALLGVIVLLESFTGRGAIGTVELLTFNPATFHYRKLIWNNGIDDVLRHPWLGLRPENWTRIYWMKSSIDNFWLFQAMRGGIPSVVFLLAALLLMMRRLFHGIYDHDVGERIGPMRRAWACSMTAIVFAGMAVHLFDKIQPYFAFVAGIGGAITVMTLEAAERSRAGGGVTGPITTAPLPSRAIIGQVRKLDTV